MTIARIPDRWKVPVIAALRSYDPERIQWNFRPRQDWQQFGQTHDAYELLIKTLSRNDLIGQDKSLEMQGAQETWTFLCIHPLNPQTSLYAKVGLIEGHISILIFSLHTDLEQQKLEKAIKSYLAKKTSKRKTSRKKK